MPIRHALWTVGATPQKLKTGKLDSEGLLEEMIVTSPGILSDEWMLIGRQERTGSGPLDLLAIAPDASLVLIELKRDRTPRDVVAQALDYATWVDQLESSEIVEVYSRFAPGRSLAEDFHARFNTALDEDDLNQGHQIVIVASALDNSTERIVSYLNDRGISINVLFFDVFCQGEERFLSRAWLLDPVRTSSPSSGRAEREPWNGEFYCSFGHSHERSWEDAVEYGFVSSGGGQWYSRTLELLDIGERIWVKVPGHGFVGVGRVAGPTEPANEFEVETEAGPQRLIDVSNRATYLSDDAEDPSNCEYFVRVDWIQTVPISRAVNEIGLFGNQNTVCKPTTPKWRTTISRLKEVFPKFDDAPSFGERTTTGDQRRSRKKEPEPQA